MAALCRALMNAGHEAILLADGGTLGSARNLNVPHAALAGNFREVMQSRSVLSSTVPVKNSLNATAKILTRLARENSEAWMRQFSTLRREPTVIVSGLVAYIGFSAAEKFGVPAVGAGMIPLTPTSAFPSPLLPPGSMPRWLNSFSYRLFDEVLWLAFRKATNAARAKVGMPTGCKTGPVYHTLWDLADAVAEAGRSAGNARMCGQWLCPVLDWEAPQSLQDFLSAGDAPIYVGFGSMAGFDQRALLDIVAAAVAGRPTLFYSGWSGADSLNLPPNFCVVGDTPHDRLFPHIHGHSSRRVRDRTFCSPRRCAIGRPAVRSRSVLLGRPVAPNRHSARHDERPACHGSQLISCYRRCRNVGDAGAGFGRRRQNACGERSGKRCRNNSCPLGSRPREGDQCPSSHWPVKRAVRNIAHGPFQLTGMWPVSLSQLTPTKPDESSPKQSKTDITGRVPHPSAASSRMGGRPRISVGFSMTLFAEYFPALAHT